MNISKTASAIHNDIVSGLPGLASQPRFSLEQLEDDIVEERLVVIKEYASKNLLPAKDLAITLTCIPTDCESLSGCCGLETDPTIHFKIPQVINDSSLEGIQYIGAADFSQPFKVYTTHAFRRHNYRRRGANKPYVWIDTTPDSEGMYNGYVFNAPLLKMLTVSFIPKDPRQLEDYSCCDEEAFDNKSFIDREVRKRVTESYVRYYRQLISATTPNNQTIA